jgi:hypothetical protein
LLAIALVVVVGCAGGSALSMGGSGGLVDPSASSPTSSSATLGPPIRTSTPDAVGRTLAPGARQMAMGISTPDSLADKDEREDEIIQSLDRLGSKVAEGGFGRYPGAFAFWTNFAEYRAAHTSRATFLTSTMLEALDARGITPMVYMAPIGPGMDNNPANTIEDAIPYSNTSIAAGSFDDHLRAWAEAARTYGKTVILRYAWEMNGTWFPWSPTQDRDRFFDLGNTPQNYVQAWRHIYTLIHDVAPNVKFFWCPHVNGIEGVRPWWPGPSYVDYIGVDGYARGPGQTMASILGPGLAKVHSLPGAGNLPMIVGETGVAVEHPDRAGWLLNGYEALYLRFPKLAGIVYFDFNMTDVFGKRLEGGNWQIETDPEALAAYRALARDPRFQGNLSEPMPIVKPSPSLPVSGPSASLPLPSASLPLPSASLPFPSVPVPSASLPLPSTPVPSASLPIPSASLGPGPSTSP